MQLLLYGNQIYTAFVLLFLTFQSWGNEKKKIRIAINRKSIKRSIQILGNCGRWKSIMQLWAHTPRCFMVINRSIWKPPRQNILPYHEHCTSIYTEYQKIFPNHRKIRNACRQARSNRKKNLRSLLYEMCIRQRAIDVINKWLKTNAVHSRKTHTQRTHTHTHAKCYGNTVHLYSLQLRHIFPFQFQNFITHTHTDQARTNTMPT